MTNSRMLTWGLWALLTIAMLNLTACSGGPTTPNPKDVKDYASGGGIGQEQLLQILGSNKTLRDSGGGAKQVDSDGYSLISLFDRWSNTDLSGMIIMMDGEGTTTSMRINGVALLKDVHYPITITARVDNYVTQTIVNTNANLLVFGMEPLANLTGPVYGFGNSDFMNENHPPVWTTLNLNTQGNPVASKNIGTGDHPLSFLNSNPYRPGGLVSFLYIASSPMGTNVVGQGNTMPDSVPGLPWTCVGYAYDELGLGGLPGASIITFNDIDTLNSYTGGTYTIPVQALGLQTSVRAKLHFAGGNSLAQSWEFIPSTVPFTVNADSISGTYTMEGVDPLVTGDRTAVRAVITYPEGGMETQFTSWDPAGSTAPEIDFAVLPKLNTANIAPSGNVEASWTNLPAEGLLTLDFCLNGRILQRVYLNSDQVALSGNNVLLSPITPDLTKIDAKLTRVSCAGIDIDGWDASTIWTSATSFAQSNPKDIN